VAGRPFSICHRNLLDPYPSRYLKGNRIGPTGNQVRCIRERILLASPMVHPHKPRCNFSDRIPCHLLMGSLTHHGLLPVRSPSVLSVLRPNVPTALPSYSCFSEHALNAHLLPGASGEWVPLSHSHELTVFIEGTSSFRTHGLRHQVKDLRHVMNA
jgi:hypothetical protein